MKNILTLGVLFVLVVTLLYSCSSEKSNKTNDAQEVQSIIEEPYDGITDLFELIPSEQSGVLFENEIYDSLQLLCFSYEYAFNGGGVAVGDINNDGLQDLCFSGTLSPNRLYLNMGNWKFKDITAAARINNNKGTNIGISMLDINNDGWLDIYICKSGTLNNPEARRNCLYINQQNLSFTEEAEKYGLDDPSYSTQAYFSDFDLDGDLDAYMINHPINWGLESDLNLRMNKEGDYEMVKDTARQYITDKYLVNQNGKFVDQTFKANVDNAAFGLSAIVHDFNGDSYPDVYICNDYAKPDRLMINQRGKGFKDEILKYFDNISASSMGSELLDVNNDGNLDFYVNDMMPTDISQVKQQQSYINYDLASLGRKYGYHDQFRFNSLQVKLEDGLFSNLGFLSNVDKSEWSWSALGQDFDHNGFIDLYICNGYLKDVTNMDYAKFRLDSLRRSTKGLMAGKLYKKWNKIVDSLYYPNVFFSNEGNFQFKDVSQYWNSGPSSFSNGAAYADLDNDGDLDIIVNNINDPAFLLRNNLVETTGAQSLRLKLESSNTTWGSIVVATFNDDSQITHQYYPIRGFVSSVEPFVHIGIPKGKSIKDLKIKWPNGKWERFISTGETGVKIITKGKGMDFQTKISSNNTLVKKHSFPFDHSENAFIDFKREPLLHYMHSTLGPCIASGDLNGDNHADVFIGGAFNQRSSIIFQSSNSWEKSNSKALDQSISKEDVDVQIEDIDDDGDNDIIVLHGGYQWDNGSEQYGVSIYYNNSDGTFTYSPINIAPKINANALQIMDLDNDQDLDIVVGAGAIPGSYPNSPPSYALINDNGSFHINREILPNSGELGLIKDISAGDLDGDKVDEIVFVGEWNGIQIARKKGETYYIDKQSKLNEELGLWQSVLIEDIDHDGDQDIVAGNLGLNSFFKASPDKPTCIYANDFDDNGENDPILCTYFGHKSYPVHSRDELLDQMTSYRKIYLRYKDFASDDIVDMFGKEKVEKSTVYRATNLASMVFINNGESFIPKELPISAQLSMNNDIVFWDIDGDDKKEVIIAGNYWETDYDYGKYDASIGAIFKISPNGGITEVQRSGLIINGNTRALEIIDNHTLLVGDNGGAAYTYKLKKDE